MITHDQLTTTMLLLLLLLLLLLCVYNSYCFPLLSADSLSVNEISFGCALLNLLAIRNNNLYLQQNFFFGTVLRSS
jgi:hypothetical protein